MPKVGLADMANRLCSACSRSFCLLESLNLSLIRVRLCYLYLEADIISIHQVL